MRKNDVLSALKEAREKSKPRKFTQSVDLVVNLKGLDLKKPNGKVNFDLMLPYGYSSKEESKILFFIKDKTFASELKGKGTIVMESEIEKISKKEAEKLASEYSLLLAEGPVMLTVGRYLGQVLAPKGKMPKPITTSMSEVEKVMKRSAGSIKVTNKKGKNQPMLHIKVGTEKSNDEELADNIIATYKALDEKLPNKKQNIKNAYLKLTMGISVKIGGVKR